MMQRVHSDFADWSRIAAISIITMLAYFVITNHINLYPWNNLDEAGSQLSSTLTGLIPFSIYALAFLFRWRWIMLIGTVHSYIWLLLQLRQWWLPYLFGSTPLHRSFDWFTEHGYEDTVSFLPAIGNRPVPDAQHIVLELLSLLVVITTTVAYLKLRERKPASLRVRAAH